MGLLKKPTLRFRAEHVFCESHRNNEMYIYKDLITGVNYIFVEAKNGLTTTGVAMTPLLDSKGNVVIDKNIE